MGVLGRQRTAPAAASNRATCSPSMRPPIQTAAPTPNSTQAGVSARNGTRMIPKKGFSLLI